MANVNFIPLGQWFPYMGKTMIVSNLRSNKDAALNEAGGSAYLFMCQLTPGMIPEKLPTDFMLSEGYQGNFILVGEITETTTISDIPAGVAFYLSDVPGEGASPEGIVAGQGCFVTSIDAGYRISGSNITNM